MSDLQKYPVAVSMLNGAKDEVGFNYVYLAHEVDTRLTHLEAVNAAMSERDTYLTRRSAAHLLENQKLQMEVNLHKRALEWCLQNGAQRWAGDIRKLAYDPEQRLYTMQSIDVPAEFAEILKGQP